MNRDDKFKRELAEVRETTRDLIKSVLMDRWPNSAAIIDFGLDSQEHYEALYYPIRNAEIMPQELDSALGHGKKLTGLVTASPSNPHQEIRFATSWDKIFGRETPVGALSEEAKLMRTLSRFDLPPDSGGGARTPAEGTRPLTDREDADTPKIDDQQAKYRATPNDKSRDR